MKVKLGFRTFNNIKQIYYNREIISEGEISGTFEINDVSPIYKYVIKDVDIIMMVLPANIHLSIIKEIIPFLQENQIILLNPGRTWGAIQVYNEIKR